MITKTLVIQSIHNILSQQLTIPNIEAFSEKARLNEDLYLDSILIMELLVALETELNFVIPDAELTKNDYSTVNALADFLVTTLAPEEISTTIESSAVPYDESDDIKVHCFVSCLCDPIEALPHINHRPFYFGVWDAETFIDSRHHLTYHSETVSHDFFRDWFQRLYGVAVEPWYDHRSSKEENLKSLLSLLSNKSDDLQVMVMLDLYLLPERENKFNQNPFPHYVLLERTDRDNQLLMRDPDFRWQGVIETSRVLNAVASPAVAGGYYFSRDAIQPTKSSAIRDYFLACYRDEDCPLTTAVETVISAHTRGLRPLSSLVDALRHLPVLAIRKYAYEHGLAFFWRDLNIFDRHRDEFEDWCDQIETLVSTYKKIQFQTMRLTQVPTEDQIDQVLLGKINLLLEQQKERELLIKTRLLKLYLQWNEQKFGNPL